MKEGVRFEIKIESETEKKKNEQKIERQNGIKRKYDRKYMTKSKRVWEPGKRYASSFETPHRH